MVSCEIRLSKRKNKAIKNCYTMNVFYKFCLKKRKKQQFFNNFAVFKQIFININNIIEKKYIMEEGCKDL